MSEFTGGLLASDGVSIYAFVIDTLSILTLQCLLLLYLLYQIMNISRTNKNALYALNH